MSQNSKPITEEYLSSNGFVLVDNTYVLRLPNNYILSVIQQDELYFPSIRHITGEIAQIGYVEILNNIPTLAIQDARYFKIDSQELFDDFLNYILNTQIYIK